MKYVLSGVHQIRQKQENFLWISEKWANNKQPSIMTFRILHKNPTNSILAIVYMCYTICKAFKKEKQNTSNHLMKARSRETKSKGVWWLFPLRGHSAITPPMFGVTSCDCHWLAHALMREQSLNVKFYSRRSTILIISPFTQHGPTSTCIEWAQSVSLHESRIGEAVEHLTSRV